MAEHKSLDSRVYIASDPSAGDDLTIRDVLECLVEECAEVIQAATKCLRFGYTRDWPGYGKNYEKLRDEIWDVLAITEFLGTSTNDVHAHEKMKKISKWKKYMREHPEDGPQTNA